MKKGWLLLGGILIGTVALAGLALTASATTIRSGDTINLSHGQIHQTVFTAGRTITIDNEVFGDVFAAGQHVTISGRVHGDVIATGEAVTVTGRVDGDIRLLGQTVTVESSVDNNATVGAQSFVLTSGATISGDLSAATTDSVLDGTIGRDLAIKSNTATVNAAIGRDIKAYTNKLTLGQHAKVSGNITYTSANALSRQAGATVGGTVTRHKPVHEHRAHWGFSPILFLYGFAAMLFTALILVLIFPRFFHGVTAAAWPHPWKALLVGFVACIVAPVIIGIVAVTLLGIPLAVFFGLSWLVILFLSGPTSAYYLGRLLLRPSQNAILIMLVGAIVLALLYFIPILDIIVMLAAVFIGTGAILLTAFHRLPRPRYTVRTPEAEPVVPVKKQRPS